MSSTQLFLHSRLLTQNPSSLPTPSYLSSKSQCLVSFGDGMTKCQEMMVMDILGPQNDENAVKVAERRDPGAASRRNSISAISTLSEPPQRHIVKVALPEVPDREDHLMLEWYDSTAPHDAESLQDSCTFLILGGLQKHSSTKRTALQDVHRITFSKQELFQDVRHEDLDFETLDGIPKIWRGTPVSQPSATQMMMPVQPHSSLKLRHFSVQREKDLPFPVCGHNAIVRQSHYQAPEIWIFGGMKLGKGMHRGMFMVWKQGAWSVVKPNISGGYGASSSITGGLVPDIEIISHSMAYRQRTDSIIVFGGYVKGKYCADVWEFHCMTQEWQRRETFAKPPPMVPSLNLSHARRGSQDSVQSGATSPQRFGDRYAHSVHSEHVPNTDAGYEDSEYNDEQSQFAPANTQEPQDGVPNSATLVGNDLLIVHEFSGTATPGALFVLNLETSTWQTLRSEGCTPDAHSFYRLMRSTPRKLLMVGKHLYSLEVMQNLKKIKDISDDLQTQISTKDLVINLLEPPSDIATVHETLAATAEEEDNEFVRAYKTQRETMLIRSNEREATSSALCHKVIMMQSQVIREKIKNAIQPTSVHHQHSHTTNITLTCPKPLFELIVQYLYGSHPALTANNVIPLMAQAQQLKLDRLRDYCLQRIVAILSAENIIHCVTQAYRYRLDGLQEICLRFISKNYMQLLKENPEFSTLPSPILYRLMRIREGIESAPVAPKAMNTVTNPLHALQKHIAKIKKGGYYHDFVLRACDGRSFRVHRAILVVKSPYFMQIVKESKTSKYIFSESHSDLVINGKLLNIILEDVYGLFVPTEGTPVSRSLNSHEMMDLVDICIRMHLSTLLNAMLVQLSESVNEENAIEMLEFAIRVQKECRSVMPDVTGFTQLKEACMSWIRKPQTDFEYGLMMSKFFEAKMEFLNESKGTPKGKKGPNKIWSEVFSPSSPRLNDSLRGSQFGGDNPTDLDTLSLRSMGGGARHYDAHGTRGYGSARGAGGMDHFSGEDDDLSSELSDLNLSNY